MKYSISLLALTLSVGTHVAVMADSPATAGANAYYGDTSAGAKAPTGADTAAATDNATTGAVTADATTADPAATDAAAADAKATTEAFPGKAEDDKVVPAATTVKGAAVDTPSPQSTAANLGGDARDSANYLPPKNPMLGKKELSWAKMESFNQLAKAEGYSDNATAAIAGNLQHESGAFQLNQWKYNEATGQHELLTKFGASSQGDKQNGVYTSFGIAQYHNDRGTDMMNFVGGKSLSPDGLQGTTNKQYEYLFQDMEKQLGAKNYNEFKSPDISLDKATGMFVEKYEIPKAIASERYGRMGGQDRYNSANFFQSTVNGDITRDGSDWNDTYVPPKNRNDSNNSTYTNNTTTTRNNTNNNNILSNNNPLRSLLGLNNNNSTNSTNSTNSNPWSSLLSSLMGQSPSTGSSTDSSSGSSTGSTSTDSSSDVSGKKALKKAIKRMAAACDVKVPKMKKLSEEELEEKRSLMVKRCRTDSASDESRGGIIAQRPSSR